MLGDIVNKTKMSSIKLNDILQFDNLDNTKIRFNLMFRQNWNPIEVFKNGDISVMLEGQYWNYHKKKNHIKSVKQQLD